MLYIIHNVSIPESEIELTAVRAQGAGGQNVNKVSSAIHLRFDIAASSLPLEMKQRLLSMGDQRITKEGVVVIKAQEYRNQEQNRNEALRRLKALLQSVAERPKPRIATKPSRSAKLKRLEQKSHTSQRKQMRARIVDGVIAGKQPLVRAIAHCNLCQSATWRGVPEQPRRAKRDTRQNNC